jgi:CHASE3 domain sensor protein
MAHEKLQRASEELQAAAEAADDEQRDRLEDQAEAFAKLAETGADHGRLARHENALREIKAASGRDVVERVDAAMEAISAYRETIEGV